MTNQQTWKCAHVNVKQAAGGCERYGNADDVDIGELMEVVISRNTKVCSQEGIIYLANVLKIFGVIKQIYHIGRGTCEKYQSRERNCSSLDWYFSQIPLPNMIYLFKI